MPTDTQTSPTTDVGLPFIRKSDDGKKKAAVVILVIVLLVAVINQPDRPQSPPQEPGAVAVIASPVANTSSRNSNARPELAELVRTRTLSRHELADVVGCRLFTAAEARPTVVPRAPATSLTAPPVRVKAIYGTSREQSAIIDDAIIRRGQALPDGRRVVEVTAEGVTLTQ